MILIAESGATKTDWRFINTQKQIEQFQTEGMNPFVANIDHLNKQLESIAELCAHEKVQKIYHYGAGIASNPLGKQILKDLYEKYFPNANYIELHSDMLAAVRATAQNEEAIVAILGTGSSACLAADGQITYLRAGLGYLLGDEGSGTHIGKQLIISYLKEDMPQEVSESFQKRIGKTPTELLAHIYDKQTILHQYMSSLATFAMQHRTQPFVYRLIYQCFADFIEQSIFALQEKTNKPLPIHFCGSVAFFQSDILRRVCQDKGLLVGQIIERPAAGLALFHQNF